jgi:signal transduction histidine kinase/CheY-like chemotaxis protein
MAEQPLIVTQNENLAELRIGSTRMVTIFLGVIAYFWGLIVVWPMSVPKLGLPPEAWTSALLLVVCVSLSPLLSRYWPRVASALLVAGTLGAVASLVLAFGTLQLAYLFVLSVVFASVLLGQAAPFIAAAMAAAFLALVAPERLGVPVLTSAVWLPILTVVLVALGSWLSARNLYLALEWALNGYERARKNEQEAQQRRAELRRALNALDEAAFRLERSRNELLVARRLAEEARAMKEQFVTTVSHELRTPLNLIVGFAEMIYLSPESYEGVAWTPDLVSDIREMYRASRHLQSLVNDILDLSRIDASRLPMFREVLDVRAVVTEAIETIAPLLKQRRLTYDVQIPENLPPVLIDRTRIRQVLINLFNNAVRFTDSGGISVEAQQTEEAIVISVRDTGIGIPTDQLERIFEEFHQVDGSSHHRGGTGLGLALSRQFVNLHGGQIWVESRLGEGSTFRFSLPLPGAMPQVVVARQTPDQRQADLSGAPVIIVDPDSAIAEMLSRYLGDHPVRWVGTPQGAEELVEEQHPLGIIINEVPGSPSEGWLGTLGPLSERYGVPILRCSLPSASWLQRAIGIRECLTKPVSREAVQQVLARYLPEPGRVLVVDDNPGFVSLMTRMLSTMAEVKEVVPAHTGTQALRLAQEQAPDLVLLDLLMPEMDGFQVLEALRKEEAMARVPVVAVTATSYPEDALLSRGGYFTLTQGVGMSPGMVTELLRQTLQVVRPNYTPEAST